MAAVGLVSHSENQAANNDPPLLPNELPLLFQMESYPYSGKKILKAHDIRLMDMTFTATNGSAENLNASFPLLLGYIPIVEMRETRKRSEFSYPEDHLILVMRVSLESSPSDAAQHSMRLETQCSHRRFRVKTVHKDIATGLLFGQVEWLH